MKESKEIKGKSSVSLQAFLLLHGTLLLYAVVTVLTKLASGYLSQANWPMTLLFLFSAWRRWARTASCGSRF